MTLIGIAFMLGAALVFVSLFRKLGLGATLGYIVGGALIGPYALGLVDDPDAIMRVSEIGIAFLLFLVGLELHPSRLWRPRQGILRLGLVPGVLRGARTSSGAAGAAAQGPLRPRPDPGGALRAGAQRVVLFRA